MRRPTALFVCGFVATLAACTASNGVSNPAPKPQVTDVDGPTLGVPPNQVRDTVNCDPLLTGGACPFTISMAFRLPEDQFVWKAYVRFQGDGGDEGVDVPYLLGSAAGFPYGAGNADKTITIDAQIPPNILRKSTLYTYSVRLVTGLGAESTPSTLTVSNQ